MVRPWPPGIDTRRRRPTDGELGPALVGPVLGGLLGGPAWAVFGGATGIGAGESKVALEQALRVECAARGVGVITFERPARDRIYVTVSFNGRYWTLTSTCPYGDRLEKEDLDDWLFGDFVDNVLPRLAPAVA